MAEAARADVTGREVRVTPLANLPARFRETAKNLRRDGGVPITTLPSIVAMRCTNSSINRC